MTDEEMAEEYAEEHKEVDWEGYDINKEELKQAFLAGLKAGRPQWHDVKTKIQTMIMTFYVKYQKTKLK